MSPNRLTAVPRPSRRSVLGTLGATMAAGATALSGCMSTLPPLGQRVRYGRVDAPDRALPTYAEWLPRPAALQTTDADPPDLLRSTMYTTPGRLGLDEIGLDMTIGASLMRTRLDYFGMGFDSYEWAMAPPRGVVLAGDVDTDRIHETLTGTVYERTESHLDFDLYRRRDRPAVVGVSGTHVVFDRGEEAPANVRALIDTGRGRASRYVDVNEDAARLISSVGASPFTWYGAGGFKIGRGEIPADPVGSAMSYTFADGVAYFVYDLLFPSGSVPGMATIRDGLDENWYAHRSAGVDVSLEGRLVTIEMRFDAEALRDANADPLVIPQVTWTESYDPGAEQLVLTHRAGDTFDASNLVLSIGNEGVDDRLSPTTGQIGPGDALTVDLSGLEPVDVEIALDDPNAQSITVIYSYDRSTEAGRDGETEEDARDQ